VIGLFILSCAKNPAKQSTAIQSKIKDIDLTIAQSRLDIAKDKLKALMMVYPNNAEVVKRLAGVNYRLNNKFEAYTLFQKADSLYNYSDKDIKYSLGIIAKDLGKIEESVNELQNYLKISDANTERVGKANQTLSDLQRYLSLKQDSVEVNILPLPHQINTPMQEYYAFVSPNDSVLYFTRKSREGEQLMMAIKDGSSWSNVRPYGTRGTGASSVSADGLSLVTSLCDARSSIGSCDLFIATKKNGVFTALANFGDGVNSIYWDAQPFISADGRTIIFSSERKGGEGGKDLYLIQKTHKGWSFPKGLGETINTQFNEESPFLHPDGKTLFFRSDKPTGLGGFDIYMSRWNETTKTWTASINLGYPINTLTSDGALTVSSDGKTAYLSSDRLTVGTQNANLDIFTFTLPDKIRANPTAYAYISTIDSISKRRVASQIQVVNLSNGQVLYTGFTSEEGSISIPILVNNEYTIFINKDGYYPLSTRFYPLNNKENLNLEITLNSISRNKPVVLNNIFFETNSSVIDTNLSKTELTYLLDFLNKNPTANIKIVGHTDSVGSESTNQVLSENRAKAVKYYLITKGINQDRISTEGKGESEPISENETDEGRRKNRRTEFYIR
jgi:outer membrane protein OmpA-like peptidoglycan-associated protein